MISQTQQSLFEKFVDRKNDGAAKVEREFAVGGWSEIEKQLAMSVHVNEVPYMIRGANINSIRKLHQAGLVRPVKDGFWMVSES